jgi:hypothetical protein
VEIRRVDDQTVALLEIDLLLCELIRRIPESADPAGSEAAESRIYSNPTNGVDPELDAEWKEYVIPEMRERFQSAIETIRSDIAEFPTKTASDDFSLLIPFGHLEAWIHGLNQARLALAARYEIDEHDMERMPLGGDERALALFQIHVYGLMQERFLMEQMESDDE